jgi:hypothetical protein
VSALPLEASKPNRERDSMNINILEKVARQTLRGGNAVKASTLTSAEHRSVKSLSWQIAANIKADNGLGSGTLAIVKPNRIWQ